MVSMTKHEFVSALNSISAQTIDGRKIVAIQLEGNTTLVGLVDIHWSGSYSTIIMEDPKRSNRRTYVSLSHIMLVQEVFAHEYVIEK